MTTPARDMTGARRLGAGLSRAVAHVLGALTIAVLLLIPLLNGVAAEALWQSAHHTDFLAMSWLEASVHLGLSAGLWALLVFGYKVVRKERQPVKRVLALHSGSIITETLVILPVLLLLTFGIGQMAINNIAGLMANTAVFQAGRAGWLWSSEAQAGRRGVSESKVEEMARVQAAAVLTPVAPGEFMQVPGGSDEFKNMRGILLGSQMPAFSQDTGATAKPTALGYLASGDSVSAQSGKDSTFARAFDLSSFRKRTVKKFTFAYQATDVSVKDSGGQVRTKLTYSHHQAMPLVGRFFGSADTVAGRPGYYSKIEREFSIDSQIPPNPERP